jgi:hypothetical protein
MHNTAMPNKSNATVIFFLLAAMLVTSGTARADLITTRSAGWTVIDFNQFDKVMFTFGPEQVGPTGLDVMFRATPQGGGITGQGSVLGAVGYGLGGNGEWTSAKSYTGLDAPRGSMTYTFNFGLVSAVGGFVNYAPVDVDLTMEALDSLGNILESHSLTRESPISTPNGVDQGAFRGIRRSTAEIAAFRLSNSWVVLDDLAFTQAAPVPEPSSAILVATMGVGLVVRRVRRALR